MKWKAINMPSQEGKIAIVTGSNTGTGYHIAYGLASKGASVIMACRNNEKAEQAKLNILKDIPHANIVIEHLDLSDLESISNFTKSIKNQYDKIDILVNNAGVMVPPQSITTDGFELQFGTNHIGHFALSGLLLPLLESAENARVITMSSIAHNSGVIDFEDLQSNQKRYSKWGSYSQSKLANLIFAIEFNRRLKSNNSSVTSLASHPGWSATDLQRHSLLFRFLNLIFGMAPVKGAAPCLYAATMDDAPNYPYWGVTKIGEMHGWTGRAKINNKANDESTALRLWDVSCELSRVSYLN
ncbi:MAG: oxidoreductase [Candidatus Poseidoniales archaeon]|jgi:NAD(P)-dependent dehydrogenase (short-subunit alcohol dehydrogenase family)|tara:strand:+ start:138 stop:1034 length:897 start_codon:yes stop_codon:yes gene_type:complete